MGEMDVWFVAGFCQVELSPMAKYMDARHVRGLMVHLCVDGKKVSEDVRIGWQHDLLDVSDFKGQRVELMALVGDHA